MKKILVFVALFITGCENEGLQAPRSDGGFTLPDAVFVMDTQPIDTEDPCLNVVHLAAHQDDPCKFTFPTLANRVDLYVREQHQSANSYTIIKNLLQVVSPYLCPKLHENPQWHVDVLLECETPPSTLP